MRLGTSTKAKVAAAILTAAIPMVGSFSASAQQMAANTPDFSRCDRMSDANPKGAISCRIDVLKAHGAAADVRGAQADVRGAQADVRLAQENVLAGCLGFLKAQKAAGKSFDRPISRDNACTVAQSMGMHPN